jgi:MFS family permease
MVRMPIGKYLSASVCLWGAVLMCHSATNNFTGLMVTRFFLGVTEASVAPGFSLLMGMFYKRKEQPFRHGLWFAGNSAANIFGGVLAYAIGQAHTSLAPWRLLFLVFGAITVFWSIVMFLILPDSIQSAKFLSQRQKEVAIARVETNNTGINSHSFNWSQVFEALRDPFTWLIFFWAFSVNLPNGGLTAFGSLVIKGFGYTGLQALLLQIPGGATQLVAVLIATYLPSRFKNIRLVTMFCLNLISLVGMVLVYALPATNKGGRLGGYCLCTVFAANIPLALSLISSNVGGFTKKATVNAVLFIAYCAGNIAGPQFYKTEEAPKYTVSPHPPSYTFPRTKINELCRPVLHLPLSALALLLSS